MNRDFENEYKDLVQNDLPDLWSKIEPNLLPRDEIKTDDGANADHIKMNNTSVDNINVNNTNANNTNANNINANNVSADMKADNVVSIESLAKTDDKKEKKTNTNMIRRIMPIIAAAAVLAISINVIRSLQFGGSDSAPASDAAAASDEAPASFDDYSASDATCNEENSAQNFASPSNSTDAVADMMTDDAMQETASEEAASEDAMAEDYAASESAPADTAAEEAEQNFDGETNKTIAATKNENTQRADSANVSYKPLEDKLQEYRFENAKLIQLTEVQNGGLYKDRFEYPYLFEFEVEVENTLCHIHAYISEKEWEEILSSRELEEERPCSIVIEASYEPGKKNAYVDAHLLDISSP